MRYLRGLNHWLERDVHDRHSEIRGVATCVEDLRNDLSRLQGPGFRPPGKFAVSYHFSMTSLMGRWISTCSPSAIRYGSPAWLSTILRAAGYYVTHHSIPCSRGGEN